MTIGHILLATIITVLLVTGAAMAIKVPFTTRTERQCLEWIMPTKERPEDPWCAKEVLTIFRERVE